MQKKKNVAKSDVTHASVDLTEVNRLGVRMTTNIQIKSGSAITLAANTILPDVRYFMATFAQAMIVQENTFVSFRVMAENHANIPIGDTVTMRFTKNTRKLTTLCTRADLTQSAAGGSLLSDGGQDTPYQLVTIFCEYPAKSNESYKTLRIDDLTSQAEEEREAKKHKTGK
jgi:hypothetical protein